MSLNVQQTLFGLAFKPQPALQTANVTADFCGLSRTNATFTKFGLNTETDADKVGKGCEFATAVYPVTLASMPLWSLLRLARQGTIHSASPSASS